MLEGSEMQHLKNLCEQERTQISTILMLSMENPRLAGYMLTGNLSMFLSTNFFVQFYPYGVKAAAGIHASIMFAFFPGDYDGLLRWPFSKTSHLSVRDQLNPQSTWTTIFAPSERISFRRPTREPLPTLMNFNFFPHSKMFSKNENIFLVETLYLEKKFTDLPDPEGATPSSFNPWCFL